MKRAIGKSKTDRTLTGEFMHTWFRFGQAIKREVVPLLERKHGADFFDFMVLDAIHDGAVYPGQVAETFVLEPSKVSRILEGLGKRHLIQRSLDPVDSRRVRLEITAEGMTLLNDVYHTVRSMVEPGFQAVGVDQVRTVIDTVEHITNVITDHKEAPEPAEPTLEPATRAPQEVRQ